MNLFNRVISAISIATLLSVAVTAHAAPNDERRNGRDQGHHQQHQPNPGKKLQHHPGRTPLPQDFSAVHRQFHDHRAQIGRGPALPPNVYIVKGKPMPRGYGKRLDARALHGLPHYQGYEWRRAGSDVVLVAVATGIVTAILAGALN